MLSESSANNLVDADNSNFNSRITYKQRFRKKGRSFVAEGTIGGTDNNQNADIYSTYSPVGIVGDTTNQIQTQLDNQFNYGLKLTYTEPLGKRKYLNLEYSHQNYNYESQKDIYDIEDLIIRNEIFNEQLSNRYINDYIYDRAGLNILFNGDKSKLTIGADLQNAQLEGVPTIGNEISNSYLYVLPSLRWNYTLAQSRRIRFDYTTSVS